MGFAITNIFKKNDKTDIHIIFRNHGRSPAIDTNIVYKVWTDNRAPWDCISKEFNSIKSVEVGEVFNRQIKDIAFTQDVSYIYFCVEYHDSSKPRELFNKYILGNRYVIEKWTAYSEGQNALSILTEDQTEKCKKHFMADNPVNNPYSNPLFPYI